ncbi:N-lysine methyltransferase KMT5A isoform X4 [Orcinus orca]|uniref:N-lysine methyltransferase KMT5A isoform X4 n=1 Tax=Orcinus orca TaxID=9733 RepID=UPI00211111A2|nr:N-lysine methyltransferase KMT5A isoform X4 [Orcinus orca]
MSTGSGTQEGSRLSRSPLPTAPGTDGSPEIAVEPARVGAWPAESPGCHYHVSHPFLPEWLRTRERGRARVGIPRGRGARPPSFPPLLPPSLRRSLAAPPLPAPSPAGSGRWVVAAASGRAAEDAPPAPSSLRPRSRAGRGCRGARVPGSASQAMGEGGAVGRRRPFPGAPRRRWWRRQQQQQRQRQRWWPGRGGGGGGGGEGEGAGRAAMGLAGLQEDVQAPRGGGGGGGGGGGSDGPGPGDGGAEGPGEAPHQRGECIYRAIKDLYLHEPEQMLWNAFPPSGRELSCTSRSQMPGEAVSRNLQETRR